MKTRGLLPKDSAAITVFQNNLGSALLGSAVFCTAILSGQTTLAQSDNPPNTMGPIIDNKGIVTQGQQGNNTIYQRPADRHLNDDMKQQLLQNLPHGRKIRIFYINTESDAQGFAEELATFLRESGFNDIDGPSGGMQFGGKMTGINVDLNKDHPERPIQISIGLR